MAERIRIVVADVTAGATPESARGDAGLGATSIARALRDAGSEVVYTGPDQTPEQIVQAVVQEDADALVVVGDADDTVLRRTLGLLAGKEADDVAVFSTGTASDSAVSGQDAPAPVTIFASSATVDEIVTRVHARVADRGDPRAR